jgi:dTDP-4-amino-4,6-dideoxygalactose transaminase
MTEIEAAIARCQLKKLKVLLDARQKNCLYMAGQLKDIPAITSANIRNGAEHAFYVQPFKFNEDTAGVSRDIFIDAVNAELPPTKLREAEGVKISYGYVKPLYLQPMFQDKIAYGSKGFPFISPYSRKDINYLKGICPVTEKMHEKELFIHELMHPFMDETDMIDVVKAFQKVWDNIKEIML